MEIRKSQVATLKDLHKAKKDCIELINEVIGENTIWKVINVKFNNRFTKTLGRCSNRGDVAIIQMSDKYYNHPSTTEDERYALMIHELLHSADKCNDHGDLFNHYSRLMEEATGLTGIAGATTKTNDAYRNDKNLKKWKATCVDCGQVYPRARRIDGGIDEGLISDKRCGKCKGDLYQSRNV